MLGGNKHTVYFLLETAYAEAGVVHVVSLALA